MPSDRSPKKFRCEVEDKDRDKKHRRRLQDALPLETPRVSDTKYEGSQRGNGSNRKAAESGEIIKHSDTMGAPRSRPYFEHNDRGQDGRRSGRRMTTEHRRHRDSKDDEERAARKTASSHVRENDAKSQARSGDHRVWKHDRFPEVEGDTNHPAKKRRPFREEKEKVVEPEPIENAAHEPSKSRHPISFTGGSNRGLEHQPFERRGLDRGYRKTALPSREGFGGGDNSGRYKGRDRFGERLGFRPNGGVRIDKWKHDLYDDANKSPTPKNEEDHVAKVEALLAS